MSAADCTIVDCPDCQSKRAGVIAFFPPKAKCSDCGNIYDIATFQPADGPSQGTIALHTEAIIEGGADQLIRAHRKAAKLSAKLGEPIDAEWLLPTEWLRRLRSTPRGRAQARYALQWRPTFLATVALSRSVVLGARAARVSPQTVMAHRKADPDFEAQIAAAQEHCVELLHAVTMRRVIEGDCEPVFWQGKQIANIKKFDGRLQIEMLRAHMPETFKTPGAKVNVNTGNQLFLQGGVCDAAAVEKLMAMRQRSLEKLRQEKLANARLINESKDSPAQPS